MECFKDNNIGAMTRNSFEKSWDSSFIGTISKKKLNQTGWAYFLFGF